MTGQNISISQNFGTAADIVMEAMDKTSIELEKAVNASCEQLTIFGKNLEKSLALKLKQVMEQTKTFADAAVDDLGERQQELAEKLDNLEASEIETIIAQARDARHKMALRADEATTNIAKLVENELVELRSLLGNPEERFNRAIEEARSSFDKQISGGKTKIEALQSKCEKKLTHKSHTLDQEDKQAIATWRQAIEAELSQHSSHMADKIASVLAELNELVSSILVALQQSADAGLQTLKLQDEASKTRMADSLMQWKASLRRLEATFTESLKDESIENGDIHSTRMKAKIKEAQDEITGIAQDAKAKIAANHGLFSSSLKRLERKYRDKLERLMNKFAATIAEETKLPQAAPSAQSSHEVTELLHAQLQARTNEITKSLRRQVEQIEAEYVRYSNGSTERLEAIKAAALESLDKQLRIMRGELARVSLTFNNELAKIHDELPAIEKEGKAAALLVMTYKNARLSFGGE